MKKEAKIILVPDIHGDGFWKELFDYDLDKVERIIFLGDYFDSFHISVAEQMYNFKEILALKKRYPDKVVLLIGNHDIHYITFNGCSGFCEAQKYEIKELIEDLFNNGQLKLFHFENDFLFSHAGLTQTFLNDFKLQFEIETNDIRELIEAMNLHLIDYPSFFEFKRKLSGNVYGDNVFQGPLWVRPFSLINDSVDLNQVVGHTPLPDKNIKKEISHNNKELLFTDNEKIHILK